MNAELKAKWTAALRSGDYLQHTGKLQSYVYPGSPPAYCCLGVLCKIQNPEVENVNALPVNAEFSGDTYAHLTKVVGIDVWRLVVLNDNKRLPFSDIADYIDANVPVDTAQAA